MAYLSGTDRAQLLLLPDVLDDYVGPNNPVRFIVAFVYHLNLATAGFVGAAAKETGHSGHDRADLLKLYVRGSINRLRSSRRLQAKAQRRLPLREPVGLSGRSPVSSSSCTSNSTCSVAVAGSRWHAHQGSEQIIVREIPRHAALATWYSLIATILIAG